MPEVTSRLYPHFDDLTDGVVIGNGLFDILMKSVKGHLIEEYEAGRIKGADYSQVYLGSLQATMAQAVQYLLGIGKLDKELELLTKQGIKLDEEILTEQTMRPLQADQLLKQTALIEAQTETEDGTRLPKIAQIEEQTDLLIKQQAHQEAQTETEDALRLPKVAQTTTQTALLDKQILQQVAETTLTGAKEAQVVAQTTTEDALRASQTAKLASEAALMDGQVRKIDYEILNLLPLELAKLTNEKDLVAAQVSKLGVEENLVAAEVIKLGYEQQLITAQIAKLNKEDQMITSQIAKYAAETSLLGARELSEAKQPDLLDAQMLLLAAQTTAFGDEVNIKKAKVVADAWAACSVATGNANGAPATAFSGGFLGPAVPTSGTVDPAQ